MNRSKYQIMASILENAKDGILIYKLIYRSALSWTQYKEYTTQLIRSELLEQLPDKSFRTTKKGQYFIRQLQSLERLTIQTIHQ